MEYKASLDLKSKIITAVVSVLFIGITVYHLRLASMASGSFTDRVVLASSVVLVITVFLFCYLYRPVKYVVDDTKVIVKRPIKDLTIDRNDIQDAFIPKKDSMRWTIRTFGNGGLFGYFGKFRNRTYGGMTWYATRTSNYLMIVTKDNHKIVLTPDDTGMVKHILKRK